MRENLSQTDSQTDRWVTFPATGILRALLSIPLRFSSTRARTRDGLRCAKLFRN